MTDKKEPNDWDALLVFPVGCNTGSEDALALADRERMKDECDADLFTVEEDGREVLDHFLNTVFGTDRQMRPKGLLRIRMKGKEE